jgi:predicted nucleic acid-binding protein
MYLDTSVLVKRYVAEPDSGKVDGIVVGSTMVSSELVLSELWSALLAKERQGLLSAANRDNAWQAFRDDIEGKALLLIPMDGDMLHEANELMLRVHPDIPLRTLDALHLASYDRVVAGPLLTNDTRMREAARALGFHTLGLD